MTRAGSGKTRERIFSFVQSFMAEKGYSPSVSDIVEGCRLSSPNLAQYHLNVLEKQGVLRREPGVFRSIQLVQGNNLDVPLLGTIEACRYRCRSRTTRPLEPRKSCPCRVKSWEKAGTSLRSASGAGP